MANEIRLDESISDAEVTIRRYKLCRKDKCMYAGGVARAGARALIEGGGDHIHIII